MNSQKPALDAGTAAVILAAGQGKRMGSDLPKVLYPLAGKPMIGRVLDTLEQLGFGTLASPPIAVVGYRRNEVEEFIRGRANPIVQQRPLGTGDAARSAVAAFGPEIHTVLLVHGDEPLIDASTYREMLALRKQTSVPIVLLTGEVSDTQGLGRVVRDPEGWVSDLLQDSELSEEAQRSREINFGAYVFDRGFLKSWLEGLTTHPSGEYYLTDLISLAYRQGERVLTVPVPSPDEQMGVNTRDQLKRAEQYLLKKATLVEA